MKISIILFLFVAFFSRMSTTSGSDSSNLKTTKVDTISVAGESMSECKQTTCIKSMKLRASSFNRIVVIYKKTNSKSYSVENSQTENIKLVDNYSGLQMKIYEGKLRLHGLALKDCDAIVCLE